MADILRSIANSTVKSGFVSSLSFGDMETGKQDSVKISSKSNPISWVVNKLRSGHNKAVKDDFLQALVGTGKFDGPIASKKIEALKSVINYESSKPLDLDQAKLAIKLFNGSVKDLNETEYASLSRTQLHALAYGTAKAALNQMMVSLAHLLARKVRVNSVLIGTVLTPGYADAGIDEAMQRRMREPDTLTGRPGRSEDVANAMLWLCSPASGWVSGQTINVHGGGGVVRLFGH